MHDYESCKLQVFVVVNCSMEAIVFVFDMEQLRLKWKSCWACLAFENVGSLTLHQTGVFNQIWLNSLKAHWKVTIGFCTFAAASLMVGQLSAACRSCLLPPLYFYLPCLSCLPYPINSYAIISAAAAFLIMGNCLLLGIVVCCLPLLPPLYFYLPGLSCLPCLSCLPYAIIFIHSTKHSQQYCRYVNASWNEPILWKKLVSMEEHCTGVSYQVEDSSCQPEFPKL